MKHSIKNYLKLGIFLFGISFSFINCEKDDSRTSEKNNSRNNNHKLKVSDLLFNDYSKNEKITSQLNLLKEKQIFAKNNRAVYNSTYDFTVQTETVRHIENTETGYESFTFAVHRENSDQVENLLISYKTDTDYFAYLVEYDFTKAEYQNLPTDIIRSRDVLMTPLNIAPSDYINDKITISIYGDIICVEEWEEIGIVSPRDLETITHYEWVITSEDCTWLNSGGGSSSGSDGDGSIGDGSVGDSGTTTGLGGDGGGGSSSDPSDSNNDPAFDPSDPNNHGGIATSPVIADDNSECQEMITIANMAKVNNELNRLKNMPSVNSGKEDGKRFNYIGSNINDLSTHYSTNFETQEPTIREDEYLKFPPLSNNCLIGAHFHPSINTYGKPVRKVPSGTDIAEHIVMVQAFMNANPSAILAGEQITNFVVSKDPNATTYALRVEDLQSVLDITTDYTVGSEKRDEIGKEVAKLIRDSGNSIAYTAHETAFSNYLSTEFPGLGLYKLEYDDNGEVINCTKL